jgi:hypothetical protein
VSGDLAFADGEALSIPHYPAAELYRAALLTARRLARLSVAEAMRTATVGELAQRVVTAFGLSPGSDWLPKAIRLEAELQTELRTCSRGAPQWPGAVGEREGQLHREMALPLTWNPFGISVHEQVRRATYAEV